MRDNVTINEVFDGISHSINHGSYNTLDFLFNVTMGSLAVASFVFIIWMAYSFIKIHNG